MTRKKKTSINPIDEEIAVLKAERENPLNFKFNFKSKTKKQKEAYNSILNKEISFIWGCCATGKSFVSIAAALQLLKDRNTNGYEKIIFIYPVEISKEESIGYLKGSASEKIQPYTEADIYTMEKIITSSGKDGKEVVKKLIDLGMIEFRPSSFLRGATIDHSIVLVSECQNFTKETFLKILTRIGTGSKYVFSGDTMQLDAQSIRSGKKVMGLQYAIEILSDLTEFGFVEMGLEDIVRNDIIIKILKRWQPEIYGNLNEEEEFKKAEKERLDNNLNKENADDITSNTY